MADSSIMVSQHEISALKEALCAQQKLLQKLHLELEAEREASATAASEALSVILRLQGEKAAVKMEAEQYKRLAEEKMCHAEESFAIIEDIINQKEMEMADLDYQVQTYKYQLMSLGLIDPSDDDVKIPENLMHRNEGLAGDTMSIHHHLGRRNSAPLLLKSKKLMLDRENSEMMDFNSREEQTCQEINELVSDSEKKADNSIHGGVTSYAEQIKELEQRVKDITGVNFESPSISSRPSATNLSSLSSLHHETRPPSPQPSIGYSDEPNKVAIVNEVNHLDTTPKKGEVVDYPCSSSVHDVFEVPQADQDYDMPNEDKSKLAFQANEVLKSKDCSQLDGVKLYAKDEPDWLKKLLQSTNDEKHLCKPSDIAAIDRALVQPTRSVPESQGGLNKLVRSSGITEEERRPEPPMREEELELLKEIKEKLNLLQDEIRCQKMKESSRTEEPSLDPLPEAMLHFWL